MKRKGEKQVSYTRADVQNTKQTKIGCKENDVLDQSYTAKDGRKKCC